VSELRARFERELDRLALDPGPALVAVSGGPDSLALLDLLAGGSAGGRHRLEVIHVDHGIHPDSGAVAARVAAAAAHYSLGGRIERLALGPGATETAARRARFAAFRRALAAAGARHLFLGHTRDDQVETVLMRFLEGSGPAGLAAIAARRGPLVRPLLGFARAEIDAHIAEAGLEPWNDPANRDPIHLRSWIRHRLLPEIESRLPRVRPKLLAARAEFGEQREALDELLDRLNLGLRAEPDGFSVAARTLQGYSSTAVRTLLRALGRRCDLTLGSAEVDRLQALLARGRSGQRVDLKQGAVGELAFGRLRLVRRVGDLLPEPVMLEGEEGTLRFGQWTIVWRPEPAPDAAPRVGPVTWIAGSEPIGLRTWSAGDRIRPLGGRGSRLVVRCMQDVRIPRSRRPDWPVFEGAGAVLWVPDVCRSDSRVPEPGVPAVRIDAGPG
jgi:tRNA(Ile)-lysidine synthase